MKALCPPPSTNPRVIEAWQRFLAERPDATHFVTLATNQPRSSSYLVSQLEEWEKRINRQLLGTRWLRKPDEWMISWFIPESIGINSHWHGIIELLRSQYEKFERIAEPTWLKLVKSGSVDVQEIGDTEADHLRAARYATKNAFQAPNYELMHVGKFIPSA